jgi:hypothetical protein
MPTLVPLLNIFELAAQPVPSCLKVCPDVPDGSELLVKKAALLGGEL